MEKPFKVVFPSGSQARAIRVRRPEELPVALRGLGLSGPRPVLVLVGGAGELSDADTSCLLPLFAGVLVPLAEAAGASVVDGGTDAGVMRLMGQARAATDATFPLVGVAATGTVALPGVSPPRHRLPYSAPGALAAAFPAGTVSGAPKVRAMEIIVRGLEVARSRGVWL